jgi:hypothetical protein
VRAGIGTLVALNSTEESMDTNLTSLDDPLAALERALIDEYLTLRGYTRRSAARLPVRDAASLLSAACEYASLRLAEIESRAQYVDEMHAAS